MRKSSIGYKLSNEILRKSLYIEYDSIKQSIATSQLKINSIKSLSRNKDSISQNACQKHNKISKQYMFGDQNPIKKISKSKQEHKIALGQSNSPNHQFSRQNIQKNRNKQQIKTNQLTFKNYLDVQNTQDNYEFTFNNNFFSDRDAISQNKKYQTYKLNVLNVDDSIYKLDDNFYQDIVLSNSFSGSFRVVLSSYIELYFQKLTFSLKLRKNSIEIFHHLLQAISQEYYLFKNCLQIDDLSLAIYRIIKNKNEVYKISQIKTAVQKLFPKKQNVDAHSFIKFFQIKQNQLYLTNPSKYLMDKSLKQLQTSFFQIFVQLHDTEVKLKKICKANEQKLIKLLVQLSLNQDLNLKMLAQFIYFDVEKGKNWLILRFQEFFKEKVGNENSMIQFLKWIKGKI